MHDSHVHLDILLQKIGILPDLKREIDLQNLDLTPTKKQEIQTKIQDLLQNHNFVLHSTVSTKNFELVFELFKDLTKVKFLVGSHPELVNDKFDLKNYLSYQENFIQKTLKPLVQKQKNFEPKSLSEKENVENLQEPKQIQNGFQSNSNQINFDSNPDFNFNSNFKQKILGIGECGLDYFYTQDKSLMKTQKELFLAQIELAIETKLPLVIHCREAFADVLDILKNFQQIHGKFLIHCFTGDKEILKQTLDLGGFVAFGGILTFGKNAEYLRESLAYCPNSGWMLETDLPFLTPNPKRGEICLPQYIDFVAQTVSEIKNLEKAKVWQISRQNFADLFGV